MPINYNKKHPFGCFLLCRKAQFTAIAISKPNSTHFIFDWVYKDIKEILLRKQKYAYAITDKKDIEKLIEYITDAKVISEEEIGATDGWTYAIKTTAQDGEYYSFIIGDSFAKWNKDSETQIVYTVETDYFKPLIEKMDSDLLK